MNLSNIYIRTVTYNIEATIPDEDCIKNVSTLDDLISSVKKKYLLTNDQDIVLCFAGKKISDNARLLTVVAYHDEDDRISCFIKKKQPEQQKPHAVVPSSCLNFLETHATQSPNQVAIHYQGEEQSYKNLNNSVNTIASFLQKNHEITEGSMVVVLGCNKQEMLVSQLALLKLGAVFIPIDAATPQSRRDQILAHANASLVICDGCDHKIDPRSCKSVSVQEILEESKSCDANTEYPRVPDTAAAYILYTSGSTGGSLKGVVQTRKGIAEQIKNYTEDLKIDSSDRFLQLATFAHDQAIVDIFGALINGASLYMCDLNKDHMEFDAIRNYIKQNKISIFSSIPNVFSLIFNPIKSDSEFPDLRIVTIGGEETKLEHLTLFQRIAGPNCTLINGYGATECSWISSYSISKHYDLTKLVDGIPLGKPASGLDVRIETPDSGGVGELCISGPSLFKEYHNSQQNDVFIFRQGKKWYKTGDLVSLDSSDNGKILRFQGRKNWHRKINGHRVNFHYIESVVKKTIPEIQDLAIIAIPAATVPNDGYNQVFERPYILYTSNTVAPISDKNWRKQLEEHLLPWEIPFRFIPVNKLPTLFNGKLDRQECKQILLTREIEKTKSAANSTGQLHPVLQLVSEILDEEVTDENESLNSLGFTSIDYFRLSNLLKEEYKKFNIEVDTTILMKKQSINEIIALTEQTKTFYINKSQERKEFFNKPGIINITTSFFIDGDYLTLVDPIHTPNREGQRIIASHYKTTDNIQIQICSTQNEFKEKVLTFHTGNSDQPLGLTFPKTDAESTHITAVVLVKKGTTTAAYVMDSLGAVGASTTLEFLNKLSIPLDVYVDMPNRQNDDNSCVLITLDYLVDVLKGYEQGFTDFNVLSESAANEFIRKQLEKVFSSQADSTFDQANFFYRPPVTAHFLDRKAKEVAYELIDNEQFTESDFAVDEITVSAQEYFSKEVKNCTIPKAVIDVGERFKTIIANACPDYGTMSYGDICSYDG